MTIQQERVCYLEDSAMELMFTGPRLRLMGLGHFITSVLIRDLAEVKDSDV